MSALHPAPRASGADFPAAPDARVREHAITRAAQVIAAARQEAILRELIEWTELREMCLQALAGHPGADLHAAYTERLPAPAWPAGGSHDPH
jgi:hypothetical protein